MPLPALRTGLLAACVTGLLAGQSVRAAGNVSTLVSFDGPNGSTPYAGLIWGSDGNLYGTTSQGGTNAPPTGFGTIFRLTPAGSLQSLASFNNVNGANPRATLVQSADGFLYGTTELGGANNQGTVFRASTNGVIELLASCTYSNGTRPAARLLAGTDGSWYGTAQFGGANNRGTVFRVRNGVLTNLAFFSLTNGANPYGEVIQGPDGVLYGTTVGGGAFGWGTIFRLATNGALSTLLSFDGTNGANPFGGLTMENGGILYGTTSYGGTGFDGSVQSGNGVVFCVSTNGSLFQTLYSFSGGEDGANPRSTLARGTEGNLFGTTILGGSAAWGTVFQITTNGAFFSLASLQPDPSGISPYASVLPGPRGSLFGTTFSLGAGLKGTVFRVDPPGAALQLIRQGGSGVSLSWGAAPGQTYQPQYSIGLHQPNWINLGPPLKTTNNILSVSDAVVPDPNAVRVYRVILQLPP